MTGGLENQEEEFRFDMVGTKESMTAIQTLYFATKVGLREGVSGDHMKTEIEWIWRQKGPAWGNKQPQEVKDGSEIF